METCCDILENLFFDFVTCSSQGKSTVATCVSWSCVMTVCHRENFRLFEILFFTNGPVQFEKLLGTSCRRCRETALPSICSCSETQELPLSTTEVIKRVLRYFVDSLCTHRSKQKLRVLVTVITQRVSPCCFHIWSHGVSQS